jgi:hypothetical protein
VKYKGKEEQLQRDSLVGRKDQIKYEVKGLVLDKSFNCLSTVIRRQNVKMLMMVGECDSQEPLKVLF